MCRVKPECEGIVSYQKTMRVHEARAKHKPDLLSPMSFLHKPKNQCKNQSGGLYIVHELHHEIRTPTHGTEEILHVIHYKISNMFFYNIRI